MSHLKSQILPFLFLFSSFLFLNASDKDEVLMHVLKGGDRTEIGVPKISYDPDMQMLSVAFHASGDYMLYIINGSGLKYIVELLKYGDYIRQYPKSFCYLIYNN